MILFFTGTGNSRFVAKRIGELINDEVVDLFPFIRENKSMTFSSEKPFVIVSPTYAWQLPRLVRDYLKCCTFSGNKKIYFILTCGTDIGNAGKYLKKISEELNLNYQGVFPVVMPENYIAMFTAPKLEEAKIIIKNALPEIEKCALKMKNEECFSDVKVPFGFINSSVVNKAFYLSAVKDKKFYVKDSCISCKKCESVCPTKNITMESGKPLWHKKCTHCMACITSCKVEAIEYGKVSVGQVRYRCPEGEL